MYTPDLQRAAEGLILSTDLSGALGEDMRLRRLTKNGQLHRVARGLYFDARQWQQLGPNRRYAMRVCGAARARTAPPPLSHQSAAVVWGITLPGPWPDEVHFWVDRSSGGRSRPGIRRHATGIDSLDVTMHEGFLVTTAARTAVDLAATLDLFSAVAVVDQVLRVDPFGVIQPLATKAQLLEVWERMLPFRGSVRARAIIEFGTHLSESLLETGSRINIALNGFPIPELQHRFVIDGEIVRTDFFWLEFNSVGEADGRSKYFSPEILRGRSTAEVVYAEKNREDGVRRQVRGFTRWDYWVGMNQQRLRARLLELGLPIGHPWRAPK